MAFGASVRPATSADATASSTWLDASTRSPRGLVGDLVPDGYDALLRLHAPAPCEHWWSAYRGVFDVIARIGQRHTTTPDRAWFAVWEGHGFESFSTHVAYRDSPTNDVERLVREHERVRLGHDDARVRAEIGAALARYPTFDRPDRTYYLSVGPVMAVGGFAYPGSHGWRNPDLWWPDDRSWFVATDVDMWSLFVAGTDAFVDEIASSARTAIERVTLHHPLPVEE